MFVGDKGGVKFFGCFFGKDCEKNFFAEKL